MITLCLIFIVAGWLMTGLVWLLALAYAATTVARFVATSIYPARPPGSPPNVCGSQRRCPGPQVRGGLRAVRRFFLRGGAAVARMAHNHEVAGSSPAPVTSFRRKPPVVAQPREAQPAKAGLRPVGWWLVFHGVLS